jgi:hypothetical protein
LSTNLLLPQLQTKPLDGSFFISFYFKPVKASDAQHGFYAKPLRGHLRHGFDRVFMIQPKTDSDYVRFGGDDVGKTFRCRSRVCSDSGLWVQYGSGHTTETNSGYRIAATQHYFRWRGELWLFEGKQRFTCLHRLVIALKEFGPGSILSKPD